MRVTEMLPETGESADSTTDAGRVWLAGRYRRAPGGYVRVNMVTTLTGSASGGDGTSETITSPTDRSILGIIRRDADVVVVGAETVRAEGYVVPRTAALAIVSRSGRLDGHRLTDAEAGRVVLVVPDGARPEAPAGVTVVTAGSGPDLSPADVLAVLSARGWERVVCEGGPTLAAQFIAAGVADEICLTVAPRIGPVRHPVLPVADEVPTAVAGALMDAAGFSYLRLSVGARASRG
ncbi:pyrimidine reductase, riboflavin biosynthesis [Microbacterium sp. TS-1]|uniref:Riboflavin biosynthesis pyrimidine reductase n=1 Tax=Microbacterium paludicola TaxID=300019 RepID=A0ABU1HZG6_9MICO|nr:MULTISPECIES: dihydrofolate reductase family protein [Microbacterium]MDR6166099.1 riboflavin biosynthesis pyrimidine reductase [Microbacterium paludicola]GAD33248.1 pyrimidine reductase, riboflavin biosynthesis [Microbacterium sp. TS-1]